MEVITSYKAFDGKTFKTERECLVYEENEILEKASELKHYCRKHSCENCVFRNGYGGCILTIYRPDKWEV